MKMKYFILILSSYSQAHPAQVLKTPIHLGKFIFQVQMKCFIL